MILKIFNNVLKNPDAYVEQILKNGFEDITIGTDVFKSVKQRHNDEISNFILDKFPNYKINLNFVRQSPKNQVEPNFIHKDDMMGEVTLITYLNKYPAKKDGTTLYDDKLKPMCILNADYNRTVAFDSFFNHSRNIYENYGENNLSRLIQVTFISKI